MRLPSWVRDGTLREVRNVIFLFIAAMVFFCIRLDTPEGLVYDESEYIPAANAYSSGVNQEASHPPLGKMILAGGIQAFGDNPWGWRIPSAIAGSALLVMVYLFTRQLGADIVAAAVASVLTAANGVLFVLARAGMLDAVSCMFLFAGVLCVAAILKGKVTPVRGGLLAGAAFGLCMACKWMALVPMAACWLALWIFRKRAAIPAMIPTFVGVYGAAFAGLALLLGVTPSWSWFRAQQVGLYVGHAGFKAAQTNDSGWWTWPLKVRPQILYTNLDVAAGIHNGRRIMLLGNPVVMWLGLAALLFLAYRACHYRDLAAAALCAVYVVFYGQYIIMPLKTEYYHYYLAASLCMGPALTLALRQRQRLAWSIAGLAVWSFIWAYPSMAALPGGHWTRYF